METDDGHQFKLETPDKRLIDVNFQRDETIGMLKVQFEFMVFLCYSEFNFGTVTLLVSIRNTEYMS